jgi:hypothetical protein
MPNNLLSSENDCPAGLLDLLLSGLGHELSLDHEGLVLRQDPLAQYLEVAELGHVKQRHVVLGGLVLHLLGNERPQLVNVDDWAVKFVAQPVEVPHADLAEVTRVVLVKEDSVVVHTSGVTSTPRVLPVLSDSAMTSANVASLLAVLLEAGRHFDSLRELSERRRRRIRVWRAFIG